MSNLVAKCGIDCSTCPWGPYPREKMTSKDFEQYKNNAKRILGYMPIRTPCLTCQTPDVKIPKESRLPNRKCLIRQCVDKTGVKNCAYCSRFPCDTLKATSGAWTRENIEKKLGRPVSEEDYRVFVEPFEGIRRLECIRASIDSERIVEPAKAPKSKRGIVDFPENLPLSNEQINSFKAVYKLLANLGRSSLGLSDTDTFAQHHKLENLKIHVAKFLWILGAYGKFEIEKNAALVVDAKTYMANRGNQKTLAIWSFVKDHVFRALAEFGVCCELIALTEVKEEDLTTGTGYLRSKGWVMRMSFIDDIGGVAALNALQNYIQKLENKYGKKSFRYFVDANMQVLLVAEK